MSAANPAIVPISPRKEMGAYEALWLEPGASVRSIAARFTVKPRPLPSGLVTATEAEQAYAQAMMILHRDGVHRFGIRVHGAGEYPLQLQDAKDPVELLYYQGRWEIAQTKCVAVVGTRQPSEEGLVRARRMAQLLVEQGITVVSGLAAGIDTAAHLAAIAAGGRTIAVIGTPLGKTYPNENRGLQERLATDQLVISQVPIVRYTRQRVYFNRLFFLERNKTMSALTAATVIIEAGESSGTLTQARAALHQGRKLFLLDSLFRRADLTWPERFRKQGAIRVRDFDDIMEHLAGPLLQDRAP